MFNSAGVSSLYIGTPPQMPPWLLLLTVLMDSVELVGYYPMHEGVFDFFNISIWDNFIPREVLINLKLWETLVNKQYNDPFHYLTNHRNWRYMSEFALLEHEVLIQQETGVLSLLSVSQHRYSTKSYCFSLLRADVLMHCSSYLLAMRKWTVITVSLKTIIHVLQ